ncbi:chemokine XC receptor 1 [Mastacembelus armatus]|uniref:Chemokine (C motif) receptor 1b, duplicate 1 n=1 Tax=Mastacembelus armatus TaxID=205130 RepID=A0A7N8XR68_9TELE|nr:chemokine XC receptor 1-like [Mastacembelus armatus]
MATTEDFTVTPSSLGYNTNPDNTSNYYSDDYEDEMSNETSVVQSGAVFTPVFLSIVVVLSLLGNILVIVILVKYENLRSLTNTFILNLAISDLFFTTGLPFWAYYHVHGWTLGDVACKMVSFVFYVGYYSSSILLILMTIHRYVAVMNPLSDIVSATGFSSILTCVIIWVVSIGAAFPALIVMTAQSGKYCEHPSSEWHLWGIYQQNIFFVVSSVVFTVCYSQIICRLLRPTAQRRRNRTIKLIFTLIVVFFVGWAPYNIVIFLQSLYSWPQQGIKSVAAYNKSYSQLHFPFYITRLLAYSHCCLNPVFYVFVGVKFKNHLKKMLKTLGHNNTNSIRNRQSQLTITSHTSGEEFSV